jgi:fucose permease
MFEPSYAAQFAGWLFAAVSNTHLCQYLGLGSMLALGAVFQIISHALRAWMPPFGLFVTTFFLVSIGQAYNDSHANTFAASIKGAHRWLAIIHASYMAGCLIGPFVATGVATAGTNSQWYLFYTFPTSIGCVNLALILWAFRDSMRVEPHPRATDDTSEARDTAAGETSKNKDAIRLIADILSGRNVWLLGMFYFFYIGSQITMSGWMVEYLVDVRDGNLAQMGFVPAGFNVSLI